LIFGPFSCFFNIINKCSYYLLDSTPLNFLILLHCFLLFYSKFPDSSIISRVLTFHTSLSLPFKNKDFTIFFLDLLWWQALTFHQNICITTFLVLIYYLWMNVVRCQFFKEGFKLKKEPFKENKKTHTSANCITFIAIPFSIYTDPPLDWNSWVWLCSANTMGVQQIKKGEFECVKKTR